MSKNGDALGNINCHFVVARLILETRCIQIDYIKTKGKSVREQYVGNDLYC